MNYSYLFVAIREVEKRSYKKGSFGFLRLDIAVLQLALLEAALYEVVRLRDVEARWKSDTQLAVEDFPEVLLQHRVRVVEHRADAVHRRAGQGATHTLLDDEESVVNHG